jgi:hypothetical protein
MQRAGTLIDKLKEQLEQNAEVDKMIVTTQLLLAELQQHAEPVNKGKITVVVPAANSVPKPVDIHFAEDKLHQKTTETSKQEKTGWLFEPEVSIPTLVHQNAKEVYELNDALGDEESLNDLLKEDKTEVAHVLQGAPVRDLRKAIGVNDRYLFINELFRGDESTYERSIKTINAFNIYAEAEYWIQRELKIKLGWDEQSVAVKQFDQLVKRRFS